MPAKYHSAGQGVKKFSGDILGKKIVPVQAVQY